MPAARERKLARDIRVGAADALPHGNEDRNGEDGDERQHQVVFDQCLSFPVFSAGKAAHKFACYREGKATRSRPRMLMAASRNRELAGDGREDGFDFITEPDQNRNGDNGNKGQDQGVFDQGLAFLVIPALRGRLVHKYIQPIG